MSLRVSFELEESDLEHFRLIMKEARKAAANLTPEDIVASGRQLLEQVAITDNLSGLYNSRHFHQMLRREYNRMKRLPGHPEALRIIIGELA